MAPTNRLTFVPTSVTILTLVILFGCNPSHSQTTIQSTDRADNNQYNVTVDPTEFVDVINNQFFTLVPGAVFTYQGVTDEGIEKNIVTVTHEKKNILGVMATVVWGREWLDGVLIEETYDWYAQDKEGNVWYLGEDSKEYEKGKVATSKGSWEAGVDGAKPGIIMKANPRIGDSYRQEYLKGEAEDMAEVVTLSESVTVPFGTFTDCLKIRDWSKIEPDVNEYKYYCAKVRGLVLQENIEDREKIELINVQQQDK
jgi:hypothetical protein